MKRGVLLANIITLCHFAWVVLILVSLPLVIIWKGYSPYAFGFVLITVVSWIPWKGCSLRVWENNLRRKYDHQNAYDGEFITHYLKKLTRINFPLRLGKTFTGIYLMLIAFIALSRLLGFH